MKDKKACILYILLTFVIWQLCISLSNIMNSQTYKLDNQILSIATTTNTGAAFGILNNNSYLLGAFGIIVIVAILFWIIKNLKAEEKGKILFLSIFTAGILGNTYERLIYGHVFDFIKINLFEFPVFNLFDVLITGSIFGFIFLYIKNEFLKRKKS